MRRRNPATAADVIGAAKQGIAGWVQRRAPQT